MTLESQLDTVTLSLVEQVFNFDQSYPGACYSPLPGLNSSYIVCPPDWGVGSMERDIYQNRAPQVTGSHCTLIT